MERANIARILRSKSSVLTFKEILIASGETKPSLLKRRLSYLVQKNELYHLRRGLYAKDKNYNRLELATKIFTPSYISFETILVEAGIIFQHYNTIFVASYQTRDIECDNQLFSFKKVKDVVLTNNAGIENRGNYYAATKERAFLDILYLNKEYHFDNLSSLDFSKIQALVPLYHNKQLSKRVMRYFKDFATQQEEL